MGSQIFCKNRRGSEGFPLRQKLRKFGGVCLRTHSGAALAPDCCLDKKSPIHLPVAEHLPPSIVPVNLQEDSEASKPKSEAKREPAGI
jgi:hypothetical protein